MSWILASASPRRAALLRQIGLSFRVVCPDIDETPLENESAADLVLRLAQQKAAQIAAQYQQASVLGADTVVVYENRIFGKPNSLAQAKEMLQTLSGNTHEVWTGLAICTNAQTLRTCVKTHVSLHEIPTHWLDAYLETQESLDKAGSYAIQGKAACFIRAIEGDFYNVVGLPLQAFWRLLAQMDAPKLAWFGD